MDVTPSDPPLRTLRLSLGDAAYTDEGQGPPVLMVHGLPGSHRDWRYLASCLKDHRVIRLDMPGFGGSVSCGQAPSFEARTRFVIEAMNALALTPPIILGHSMGGPVAAMVANAVPDQVRALGLVASPGLRRHRCAPGRGALLTARLLAFPQLARWMQRPLAGAYRAAGFPSSLTHGERVAALRQVTHYAPTAVRDQFQALRRPTLVAFADDDALVEPEIGVALGQACPDGPRLRFATGGHNIQKTQCEAIAEALTTWAV